MKTLRALPVLLLLIGSLASGQTPVPEAGAAAENAPAPMLRTAQELEQLLAPIALYPDALIAIILPAAASSTDIVLAARYLRDFPDDRSQVENRAWDDSVKSLTNYPDVLKWMDENLQWTKQVGEAFATQPADVMQTMQRLRAQARAAGTLVDTPQQQVIAEPDVIRIVPAQPDVIYVPSYEPDIVFVDRPVYYPRPFLTFGAGVAVGSWLAFDCDWRHHTIWVGNRHRPWVVHDWHRPLVPFGPSYAGPRFVRADVRQWRPPPVAFRASVTVGRHAPPPIIRPTQFGFAAAHGHGPRPAVAEVRPLPSPVVNATAPRLDGRRDGFTGRGLGRTNPAPAPGAAGTNFASTPSAPANPTPEVATPAPAQRRYGADGMRGHRVNPGQTASVLPSPAPTPIAPVTTFTPAPTVTTTPAVPAQRRAGIEVPREHSYHRNLGNNAAALSSPPVANTPAPAAPAPTRTYSRPQYVAPAPSAAPAPAPAAAPAPAQPARNESSNAGHRGSRGRNEQER